MILGIFFASAAVVLMFLMPSSYASSEKERLEEIQKKSGLENPSSDRVGIPQYRVSTSDSYGIETFDIDGQLQNNREEDLFAVQITASFFDNDGQFLGSETGSINTDPLPQGQTVPFKINLMSGVTNIPIDDIGSIKFRIGWMNNAMITGESTSSFSSSSSSSALPALPLTPPPPPVP